MDDEVWCKEHIVFLYYTDSTLFYSISPTRKDHCQYIYSREALVYKAASIPCMSLSRVIDVTARRPESCLLCVYTVCVFLLPYIMIVYKEKMVRSFILI